jgi:hypothetical protein
VLGRGRVWKVGEGGVEEGCFGSTFSSLAGLASPGAGGFEAGESSGEVVDDHAVFGSLVQETANGFEDASAGFMFSDDSTLVYLPAPSRMPLALYLLLGAIFRFMLVQPVADHIRLAIWALRLGGVTVVVEVRAELRDGDELVAELARDVPMQAALFWAGVPASNELTAQRLGAGNQSEFAAALVVPLEILARAHVLAALVGTPDFEAVELFFDDQGQAAIVAVLVDRLPVDGAGPLHLKRSVDAPSAKCMAAWGCDR